MTRTPDDWTEPAEPRVKEFELFHELLTAQAPDGWQPHYLKLRPASKAPKLGRGWKNNPLPFEDAVRWMESGGNVGIAGRDDGPLVNMDRDDAEDIPDDEIKKTLGAKSRSRVGDHYWYFNPDGDVPNIPTADSGEVRAQSQYVVAPGSYVPVDVDDPEEPNVEDFDRDGWDDVGYYTVERENEIAKITFEELPSVFRGQHLASQRQNENAADESDVRDPDDDFEPTDADGDVSSVFDLSPEDIVSREVGQKSPDERWSSMFHGSKTDANMSISNRGRLQCWRHQVAHGGLQTLAVLSSETKSGDGACLHIGKGHTNSGGGPSRLRGGELIWPAWEYAKRRGHIPADDPVPRKALIHLATEHGLCDASDIDDWELPAEAYDATLKLIEDEYGLNPGRPTLNADESDGESDDLLTAVLNSNKLQREVIAEFARRRGHDWPTTREARSQLRDVLGMALRSSAYTIIDAPTGLGKTFTVASEAWRGRASTTGGAPVIHLHATRKARDEAAEMSDRAGVTYRVLKGRSEACELAAGDHDDLTVNDTPASEWFDELCDNRGLAFSMVHALFPEVCDQGIDECPCQVEGTCDAHSQYDGIPWTDDGDPAVDVIHATHNFAFVPSLRLGTNIVCDEMPDYSTDLGQGRIRRAITAYLSEINAPVTTFESFVSMARHDPYAGSTGGGDAADEREQTERVIGETPDREWYVTNPDAHTLAPALTEAIWRACESEPNATGRSTGTAWHEQPRFEGEEYGGAPTGTVVSVVVTDENDIVSVRNTPSFKTARCLVGMDAHPSEHVWRVNTVPGMDTTPVLQPTNRQLWRRFERGLTTVQIGDATRPRSGSSADEWTNERRLKAVVDRINEVGDLDTAVSSIQVKDTVRDVLVAAGSDDPDLMHYGNEKSRNDFAGESVGYVYGCMDPGDDMILNILAELELDAEPVVVDTDEGKKREKGRTFEGPDAEAAADVLASVRENHVAQAAGRYARDAGDDDDRAVVFVDTNAAPDGLIDVEAPGVERLATDTQAAIVEALRTNGTGTVQELAEAVGCTESNVRHTLSSLEDQGLVQRASGAGPYGADIWRDDGATAGDVNIDRLPQSALQESTNRWLLCIRDAHLTDDPDDAGESATSAKPSWPAAVETD